MPNLEINYPKTQSIREDFIKLRHHYKFSQDYLAAKLGVSQTAYSKYELGKNSLASEHFVKLFELYEMDVNSMQKEKLESESV